MSGMESPGHRDRAHWPDSTIFEEGTHPSAVFTYVLSGKRGKKPKQGAVYDRAKRATIDREITDHAIDFIVRKPKPSSLSSPISPIRKPMIRPIPIPTTRV